MKKILFGLVAAAGMLFATSCAKDVDGVGVPSGDKATVTFNVGLENVISTRATGDGQTVTTLYYAAFNETGEFASEEVAKAVITGGKVTGPVALPLENGKTYKVAFWAQNDDAGYTVGEEDMAITVNYDGAKNNDESRDAFYALESVIVSNDGLAVDVTLKRAVAQINLGVQSEKLPTETQMVVDNAHTAFNVFTGEATGSVAATFAYAAPLTDKLKATPQDAEEEYSYLSMTYLLVNEKDAFNEVSFSFKKEGDETVEYSRNNVPANRNYRTNLLGVFEDEATEVEFNVTIDPSWGGEDDEENLIIGDGDDDGDDDDNNASFTVSSITATVENQAVSFEAEYAYEGDEFEAWFVCTPDAAGAALTRANDGTIEVKAVKGEKGKLTATEDINTFKAGVKYNVALKVVIDGEEAKIETTGDAETQVPEITVPEEQGGDNNGDDDNKSHTGTAEDPFTVAEAIAKAEETGETATADGYYIKGIVKEVTSQFSTQYGNANFTMIDADAPDAIFTAYRANYLNNQPWTESDDLVYAGDEVIVYGQIVNYKGNTPETNQGSAYIYQFISQVPTIANVKATVEGKSVTFTATYTNRAEVVVAKAGFKYGIEGTNTDASVVAPTDKSGEITTTVEVEDYGTYSAIAYLNDIETAAISFSVKDPNAQTGSLATTKLTTEDILRDSGGNTQQTTGYREVSFTDANQFEYNAFAISTYHSKAANTEGYIQIKKYASNTASYIQLPTFTGNIQSIKMTATTSSAQMSGAAATAKIFFSSTNSTASSGDGVVTATSEGSVFTIDASSLNLNTGYITADGAVRIWEIEITYFE